MGQVAILNDLHLGYGGSNSLYAREAQKFFDNVFIPWVDENDVVAVVVSGDLMDNRREINVRIANELLRRSLLDRLSSRRIPVHVIPGNHDIYYRNKIRPNSLVGLDSEYENVTIHEEPTEIVLNGVKCLMLPWICEENEASCDEAIASSRATHCFAHLELIGFEYQAGVVAKTGDDAEKFSKFSRVLTGHYHSKSERDNILYMGTQYHMTRADAGVAKYFHSMNSDGNITAVENPSQLYFNVHVRDGMVDGEAFDAWMDRQTDTWMLDGGVGVFTFDDECSESMVDDACRRLAQTGLDDFKVVDFIDRSIGSVAVDECPDVVDTMSMVRTHVEGADNFKDLDRDRLFGILSEAHAEAISAGV